MGNLYSVALSGIQAAQVGLNTTGHNIANVNTPGYSRQTVSQAAQQGVLFGPGFVGSGVNLQAIGRSYNELLAGQVRSAQAQASQASAYSENVSQLNAALGDPNGSVSTALSGFFGAVQGVTASPGDVALRQSVYASAQTVVQRFRGLDQGLAQQRAQINNRAENLVADLNSRTQEIADLSLRISTAFGSGRSPNDLLDQRDAMLTDLNKLARITVTNNSDGSINVFLTNGQPLLNGVIAQKLEMVNNPEVQDAPVLGVRAGNTVTPLAANGDVGGELGGLLAARDDALASVETALGRMARVFTSTMNSRNQLGLDRNGNPGGDFFAIDPPEVAAATNNAGSASVTAAVVDASALQPSDYHLQVTASGYTVTRMPDKQQQTFATAPISIDGLQFDVSGSAAVGDSFNIRSASGAIASMRVALPDSNSIATASPLRIDSATSNTGTASTQVAVDAADPALHDPAQLTFDGAGHVTVTTAAGSTVLPYTGGSPISLNGWSVTVRGAPAAGDVFQISANTVVDGDNRNALGLSALETQQVLPGMTFSGAYSSLIVDIGTKGRDADATQSANEGLAASLKTSQDAASGVNLDEEAINMMRYQQAYQAAGKMIGVANAMFDAILSIAN